MSELPEPLTPPDCDLQDFQFMPLDVDRLRDSDLASDEKPESCWAAVLLWCASWHQIPSGSIPDNENWIAKQAGYAQRGKIDREWQGVRSGALRGWVKCSDGRLYHPVVAEKARDAWQAKCEQRWRTESGRIKKHNQRHKTNIPMLDFVSWTNTGRPQGQLLFVPEDNQAEAGDNNGDNASKRQGEGQGQGQGQGDFINTSVPNGTGGEPPDGQGETAKTPEQMTKDEIWKSGKSILLQADMPKDQCGTFLGKLVSDYGAEIVVEAVRAAVVDRPADPASFLKACCMARKKEGGKSLIPWHGTDAGVLAKGLEMTPPMTPHPGESMFTFKARLIAAIENGGKPPAPRSYVAEPPPAVESKRDMSAEAVAARQAALAAGQRKVAHD